MVREEEWGKCWWKIKPIALDHEIMAIGTNSIATSAMLKAGADYGATGENPIVWNCKDADIILTD